MTDDGLITVLNQALKDGHHARDDLYLYDTMLAWQMTNEANVDEVQRLKVHEALCQHADIAPLMGAHVNCGINSQKLIPENIAKWLLTRAFQSGANEAVKKFRAFLDSQHCEVEEYLAFSGLETDAPITLTADIDLIPITDVPESLATILSTDPDWSDFGRNAKGHVRRRTVVAMNSFGKSKWHTDPHIATVVLRIRHKRSPKLLAAPIDITNSLGKLLDTVLVLAAATSTAMFPVMHWFSTTPATPLSGVSGWSRWFQLDAIRPFATTKGIESEIAKTVAAWEALPSHVKSNLTIPLDRLNRAPAAPSAVDCAIELGVALEALLLTEPEPNAQLALSFRLRGAWLLGETLDKRRELFKNFRDIYNCRSSAVHTGKLPTNSLKVNGASACAHEFITKNATRLAASAILHVISLKRIPEWKELLLGAEG